MPTMNSKKSLFAAVFSLCFFIVVSGAAIAGTGLPFNSQKKTLYTRDELWSGYDSDPAQNKSLDWKIYQYFSGKHKYFADRWELIEQRVHDSNMDLAVNLFLELDQTGLSKKK